MICIKKTIFLRKVLICTNLRWGTLLTSYILTHLTNLYISILASSLGLDHFPLSNHGVPLRSQIFRKNRNKPLQSIQFLFDALRSRFTPPCRFRSQERRTRTRTKTARTAGAATTTRTRSSTWTSLSCRRAPATCCPRCASWPSSTPSSLCSAWSATTVWRRVPTGVLPSGRCRGWERPLLASCLCSAATRCLWWCSRGRRRSPGSWSSTASTSPSSRPTTTSRASGTDSSSTRRE